MFPMESNRARMNDLYLTLPSPILSYRMKQIAQRIKYYYLMATDSTVHTFLTKYSDCKITKPYVYIYKFQTLPMCVYTFYRTPSLKGPESRKSFMTSFTCTGKNVTLSSALESQ